MYFFHLRRPRIMSLETVHHFMYCWNVNLIISSIHLSTAVILICNLLSVFFIIRHKYEYEYETSQLCAAACPFLVILPFALIPALLGYLNQQQLYYCHFQDNLGEWVTEVIQHLNQHCQHSRTLLVGQSKQRLDTLTRAVWLSVSHRA